MDVVYKSHSGYFDRAFGSIDDIALDMLEQVKNVEFDTMVGTGLSGTLVVPTLARTFGTKWAILRKESSPHSSVMIEGEIGHNWLFVDDFVSSGRTRDRVRMAIEGIRNMNWDATTWEYSYSPIETKYVGTYEYERNSYTEY